MYEVEVKVRADHETVRAALQEEDARRIGTVAQSDIYYDAPHRNFAETDEALRIRREVSPDDSETVLTYKGPLVEADSKTREEIETPLVSRDEFETILDALGFEPAATVEKERERWHLDGYVVSLDRVNGLGQFVEVEAEAAEDAIESTREGAYAVLQSLGLDPDSQIRTSYLGLLLARDDQQEA